MRYIVIALVAALVAITPAGAQRNVTPQQHLDCAAWAAVLGSSVANDSDRVGAAAMLAWFIGLYEGATGEPIDEALSARLAPLKPEQMEGMAASCGPRAIAFG